MLRWLISELSTGLMRRGVEEIKNEVGRERRSVRA